MTTTLTPLPAFLTLFLQDHKVDPSNIRIINDNARSQLVPSFRGTSSSNGAATTTTTTTTTSLDINRRFQAMNRWKHDTGYDSDTSLMLMLAGRRRKVSLESPYKMVRFMQDNDEYSEDKWSKPSSDSCLCIPQRKSSLTQSSLDEDGKQAMFKGNAGEGVVGGRGRPPLGATEVKSRSVLSKSPPKQNLFTNQTAKSASMDCKLSSSTSPPTLSTIVSTSSSPSNTAFGKRIRQRRRTSLDSTILLPSTATNASIIRPEATPARYSDGSSKTKNSSPFQSTATTTAPSNSTSRSSIRRRHTPMDTTMMTTTATFTNISTYRAHNNKISAQIPNHPGQTTKHVVVTPPSIRRIKKKSKTNPPSSSSSPVVQRTTSESSSSNCSSSSACATAAATTTTSKYRIPSLGYMLSA